jgi:hypothetical protein
MSYFRIEICDSLGRSTGQFLPVSFSNSWAAQSYKRSHSAPAGCHLHVLDLSAVGNLFDTPALKALDTAPGQKDLFTFAEAP